MKKSQRKVLGHKGVKKRKGRKNPAYNYLTKPYDAGIPRATDLPFVPPFAPGKKSLFPHLADLAGDLMVRSALLGCTPPRENCDSWSYSPSP